MPNSLQVFLEACAVLLERITNNWQVHSNCYRGSYLRYIRDSAVRSSLMVDQHYLSVSALRMARSIAQLKTSGWFKLHDRRSCGLLFSLWFSYSEKWRQPIWGVPFAPSICLCYLASILTILFQRSSPNLVNTT